MLWSRLHETLLKLLSKKKRPESGQNAMGECRPQQRNKRLRNTQATVGGRVQEAVHRKKVSRSNDEEFNRNVTREVNDLNVNEDRGEREEHIEHEELTSHHADGSGSGSGVAETTHASQQAWMEC